MLVVKNEKELGIEYESCSNNGRRGNKPIVRAFHPARGSLEGGVLQPLNAMWIAAATAQANDITPLAEPQRLTRSISERVVTDVRHDSDKLSALKLSTSGADLEGEYERPVPAKSLTNELKDVRREYVGHLHLKAGERTR